MVGEMLRMQLPYSWISLAVAPLMNSLISCLATGCASDGPGELDFLRLQDLCWDGRSRKSSSFTHGGNSRMLSTTCSRSPDAHAVAIQLFPQERISIAPRPSRSVHAHGTSPMIARNPESRAPSRNRRSLSSASVFWLALTLLNQRCTSCSQRVTYESPTGTRCRGVTKSCAIR
eukprot:scaffold2229_cov262-Pinguiococcus_pyrenoidosus.AAC.8